MFSLTWPAAIGQLGMYIGTKESFSFFFFYIKSSTPAGLARDTKMAYILSHVKNGLRPNGFSRCFIIIVVVVVSGI